MKVSSFSCTTAGKFLSFDVVQERIEIQLEVRDKSATVFFRLDEIKMLHLLAVREWLADGDLEKKAGEGFSQQGEQLEQALAEQKQNRERPLGRILVEAGVVSKKDIQLGLAKKLGIPFIDLRKFPVDPEAYKLIPEAVARKHQVLPLFEHNSHLAVALLDPLDYKLLETLQFYADRIIDPVFALEEDLKRSIELAYKGMGLSEILSDECLWEEEKDEEPEALSEPGVDGVGGIIIKLVNKLITDADLDGASDIHIEPRPGNVFSGHSSRHVPTTQDGLSRQAYPSEIHPVSGWAHCV